MRNNVKELAALVDEAVTFLERESLPATTIYNANLVLEEVLTNILKYAFEDPSAHQISVLLTVNDTDLVIRFVDDGLEFDPLSVPPPAMVESVEGAEEGGLGVYLVRKRVTSIEYCRNQSRNILETKFSLHPPK